MFKIGDKVIYGKTGVCTVVDICEKTFIKNQKRAYYVLKPMGVDNNFIYAPIDGGKIFMRHLITKAQAVELIDSIPDIVNRISDSAEVTKEEYNEMINNHSLEDLVELTAIIYSKKLNVTRVKKRLNAIDEKYMKISENLLFGEFAEALGISVDEVPGYIKERIEK